MCVNLPDYSANESPLLYAEVKSKVKGNVVVMAATGYDQKGAAAGE